MKAAFAIASALIAVAAASAATAATGHTARFVSDARSGYSDRGASAHRIVTDARDRGSSSSNDASYRLIPDARGGYSDRSAPGRAFLTDARGGYGARAPSLLSAAPAAAPAGFDWLDAGVGSLVAIWLLALGGGAFLIVRRRRQPAL